MVSGFIHSTVRRDSQSLGSRLVAVDSDDATARYRTLLSFFHFSGTFLDTPDLAAGAVARVVDAYPHELDLRRFSLLPLYTGSSDGGRLSLGFEQFVNGYDYRISLDTPVGFALTYQHDAAVDALGREVVPLPRPVAICGLDCDDLDTLLIKQLQALSATKVSVGDKPVLVDGHRVYRHPVEVQGFHYQAALVLVAAHVAHRLGFSRLGIQSIDNNTRYGHKIRDGRDKYDGTAALLHFDRDDVSGNWFRLTSAFFGSDGGLAYPLLIPRLDSTRAVRPRYSCS